jgi:hypothetical protein
MERRRYLFSEDYFRRTVFTEALAKEKCELYNTKKYLYNSIDSFYIIFESVYLRD